MKNVHLDVRCTLTKNHAVFVLQLKMKRGLYLSFNRVVTNNFSSSKGVYKRGVTVKKFSLRMYKDQDKTEG